MRSSFGAELANDIATTVVDTIRCIPLDLEAFTAISQEVDDVVARHRVREKSSHASHTRVTWGLLHVGGTRSQESSLSGGMNVSY